MTAVTQKENKLMDKDQETLNKTDKIRAPNNKTGKGKSSSTSTEIRHTKRPPRDQDPTANIKPG